MHQPVWELSASTRLLLADEQERAAKLARLQAELAASQMICGECFGTPEQYRADMSEQCPTCDGAGIVSNPDYIDGDDRGFDPRREYGTQHRRYARAA